MTEQKDEQQEEDLDEDVLRKKIKEMEDVKDDIFDLDPEERPWP